MAQDDNPESKVRVVQGITPAFLLQALLVLAGLAGLYTTMASNDAKLFEGQNRQQRDIERIDRERDSLRSEIRSDLKDIKEEIKQLNNNLNSSPRSR